MAETQTRSENGRASWLLPALVVVAGVLPFLPAAWAPFFSLGDQPAFLQNESYRGLGPAQLKWMFFSFQWGAYRPLTWLTHSLDYLLWGLAPAGYHVQSIALHALNGLLLYFLVLQCLRLADGGQTSASRRPGGDARSAYGPPGGGGQTSASRRPGGDARSAYGPPGGGGRAGAGRWADFSAAAGAAWFAAHPMRVEAIAWASQRGYLLALLFALCSTWAYLESRAPRSLGRKGWLAVSLGAFALSLLGDPQCAGLPLVLLCLDACPLGRLSGREALREAAAEKLPYFALSLAAIVVSANAKTLAGRVVTMAVFGPAARLSQAMFGAVFYLEKSLLPTGLAPFYETVKFNAMFVPTLHPFDTLCSLRTLAFIALSILAVLGWRRRPALAAVWASYLVLFAPVSGLAKSDLLLELAADRWAYVPCACLGLGLGLALSRLRPPESAVPRAALAAAAGLLLLLGGAAGRQSWLWADTGRLWEHTVRAYPSCLDCRIAYGRYLNDEGRSDEALTQAKETLRITPSVDAYIIGIRAAHESGLSEEADRLGALARQLNAPACSQSSQSEFQKGFVLSQAGRMEDALAATRVAVSLDPGNAGAQYNLGFFCQTKGLLPEAERRYREAVRLNPQAANSHHNLGVVLAAQGKVREAVPECQEAARINPAMATPDCPAR